MAFLQWALPRLRMRWPGFRKVRRMVCKRIDERLRSLGLADVGAYRMYLEDSAGEWTVLDGLCSIPISRFYRDRAVFDFIAADVLPALARHAAARREPEMRAWSCGCAAGEEPYTLTIMWKLRRQGPTCAPLAHLRIIGTDTDATALARARTATYRWSSVKDLPAEWRERAFEQRGDQYCLRPEFRRDVEFLHQDVRTTLPERTFDLILCRNLVFTYFDEALQRDTLERLVTRLTPDGVLVIGKGESLPAGAVRCEAWSAKLGVYRHAALRPNTSAPVFDRNS